MHKKSMLPRQLPSGRGPLPAEVSPPRAPLSSTAVIAHDLRNLLGVVQGRLLLLADEPGCACLARTIDELSALVDRTIALTRQLTTAPAWPARPLPTCARDVLLAVAEFARQIVPCDVRLEVEAPEALAVVCVDRHRLEQALLNLVVNAVHAVTSGGTIRLDVARAVLPLDAGAVYVVFSVTDDGHGIPEALRQKVFEPYFSTKPSSVGSGLGLPSVSDTARAFGGWLEINSAHGQGTRARLYLPAATP
jgi:signal transduction histidine kinase